MAEDFQAGVQACSDDNGFDSDRWGQDGIPEVAPLWLLKCLPNMPACHLAILNDLRGPGNTITQRDVAANMAIAEACRIIRDGDADAMVVGATGTHVDVFFRRGVQSPMIRITRAIPTTTCVAPLTSVVEDPFREKVPALLFWKKCTPPATRGVDLW
jgi:hypothetical protein